MTLEDIKQMDKGTITAAVAAPIIGCDPQYIRLMARLDASKLGFPVIVYRSRVKIPRIPFIKFMEGDLYEKAQ